MTAVVRMELTENRPVGQHAVQEVRELQLGAKALNRAHTCSRRHERQNVINRQRSEQGLNHSADFHNFIKSVMDAEKDLPDESVPGDPPSRPKSWETSISEADARRAVPSGSPSPMDRDELYLPGDEPRPSSKGQRMHSAPALSGQAFLEPFSMPAFPERPIQPYRSYTTDTSMLTRQSANEKSHEDPNGPPKPPKVPELDSPPQQAALRKQVTRKPVTSSFATPGASSAFAAENQRNTADELLTPPMSPAVPMTATTTTSMLFNQVSRSLSSLAEDVASAGMEENADSPPPYVDAPAASSAPGDWKRQRTQSESAVSLANQSAIQLVRENRPDTLQAMVRQGFAVDEVDPVTKRTALMEAAGLRRGTVSKVLVGTGIRLHLKDQDGSTALHYAALQGDANICRILLDAGAQLDEHNRLGETPLQLAARGGHTDAVMCLLNGWTAQKSNGLTLQKGFLDAAKSCSVNTAQAFVAQGVRPKKIKESWKPVAYAAESGSIPMIDFMLAQKCNIKERSPDGWTALHFASRHGHTAMVEKLLALKISWKAQTRKGEETALHLSVRYGHTPTATALILHKDAAVTLKDKDGHQALHHACRQGDLGLTTALLNHGAKLDEQTKYGWKPVHLACAYGHLSLVAEFITRGVSIEERSASPSFKPSKQTNDGARKGYWSEIRWPHPGARPLHLALEFGQDEVANMLIASAAKIDEADSKDWRPLHYAAFNCRPHMVDILLSRGASPHATTSDGNTALSLGFREPGLLATQEEKIAVWELLQGAMNSHKKSKFKQLTGFMNSGNSNKSRDAGERNKAWHMAELAAALYLNDQFDDGEDDADSQLTPSTSSQLRAEGDSPEDATTEA